MQLLMDLDAGTLADQLADYESRMLNLSFDQLRADSRCILDAMDCRPSREELRARIIQRITEVAPDETKVIPVRGRIEVPMTCYYELPAPTAFIRAFCRNAVRSWGLDEVEPDPAGLPPLAD